MKMSETEAARAYTLALLKEATRVAQEERKRLGRDLTKAEAKRLAKIIEREVATALEMLKGINTID